MKSIFPLATLLLLVPLGGPASAQQQPTVVQLPTFSFFQVNTTVMVPDSGGGYLGGLGRAAGGSNSFGPPLARPNRAIGLERQALGMQAGAVIHDFDAVDAFLLRDEFRRGGRRAAAAPQPPERANAKPADRLVNHSVADIKRRNAAARDARQQKARELLDKGQRAQERDKPEVARIYYRMAAKQAEGALQAEALRLLRGLGSP